MSLPLSIFPLVLDSKSSFKPLNNQQQQMVQLRYYSHIPVYQYTAQHVTVMRRQDNNFVNATQILKSAGLDKGRRTKILERQVAVGVHEKIQGGFGKFQGTWIPIERAIALAKQFNVYESLSPLFKDQEVKKPSPANPIQLPGRSQNTLCDDDIPVLSLEVQDVFSEWVFQMLVKPEANQEKVSEALLVLDTNNITDIPMDEDYYTLLHWLSAFGYADTIQKFFARSPSTRATRKSRYGETSLMSAVHLPFAYHMNTFSKLCSIFESCLFLSDLHDRTLLHHLFLTYCDVPLPQDCCYYYLSTLLEYLYQHYGQNELVLDEQFQLFLNQKDYQGNTALQLAIVGKHSSCVRLLMMFGAQLDPAINLKRKRKDEQVDISSSSDREEKRAKKEDWNETFGEDTSTSKKKNINSFLVDAWKSLKNIITIDTVITPKLVKDVHSIVLDLDNFYQEKCTKQKLALKRLNNRLQEIEKSDRNKTIAMQQLSIHLQRQNVLIQQLEKNVLIERTKQDLHSLLQPSGFDNVTNINGYERQ